MTLSKVAVVFGTRPEAIKLAPVIRELEHRGVQVMNISTGQHLSMLWQALDFFEVETDHDLGAMHEGQSMSQLLTRIFVDVEALMRTERPDAVVVQGDTATALGGSLAAYFARVPVAHVEAGLRSFDDMNPFPEEANRSLIARVARWHFAPTESARQNLLRENISDDRIRVTGNTIVDALEWGRRKMRANSEMSMEQVAARVKIAPQTLRRFILVTSHRRENFGKPLADVCSAICQLEHARKDVSIVWPVHLNPSVRKEVHRALATCGERVVRIEPVNYEVMLYLLEHCTLILTDSGGIQEEAAVLRKPVLIMRRATERPEVIEAGIGKLVGTDPGALISSVNELLDDDRLRKQISDAPNPFGDGHAAERIVEALLA
ncbi:MAG: UDP-N-acetylglucosamine 2-epimerase (non-hydrolyzing) [Thermoanaerobaculia bacterium]